MIWETGRRAADTTGGFTVLELVLVLLIAAILAGAAVVNFGTFFDHQSLKETAAELRKMARLASREAATKGQTTVISFSPRGFALGTSAEDVEMIQETVLPEKIRLEVRSREAKEWSVPRELTWTFAAGGGAQPLRVRLRNEQGAFEEMTFHPLTGAVSEKRASYP
ncbi:MAG: hypothetical protein AAF191_07415 [Verrucomicrobiota bacterium]